MSEEKAPRIVTIDEVVRSYIEKGPALGQYQREAAKIAHFYSAGIIGDIRGPEFYQHVNFVDTEDAQVISIETVLK